MKIFGIDFTSAPSRRKPITSAHCELEDGRLRLIEIQEWASFAPFENFLQQSGQWVCGLDFPFGQPRRLLENIDWPGSWSGYVSHVSGLGKEGFEKALTVYRRTRPKGDKQHLRRTDELCKSCSPMMLYGVPVGKMFFQGAPRLLKSEVCVLPCRPNYDIRIALEAYPALVARRWTDGKGYKSDTRSKQTAAHWINRQSIANGLMSAKLEQLYGFRMDLVDDQLGQMVEDATGDMLDALLCAIQAAWAYLNRDEFFGIPCDVDADEGWIIDPTMISAPGPENRGWENRSDKKQKCLDRDDPGIFDINSGDALLSQAH